MATDPIYLCDDGIQRSLDSVTGKATTPIGNQVLRLVKATFTGSKTRVIGDFSPQATFEANFAGYAAITLTGSTWPSASVAANVASSAYGNQTFTRSSTGTAQTIYGWILTDSGFTKLYANCVFTAGPYTLTNNGDSITVNPQLTEQSLN
jgi:hypothetical protein